MTLGRLTLAFSCFSVFAWIIAKADQPAIHLVRQRGVNLINPLDENFGRLMKWSHGAYLFADALNGQRPVFYSLDAEGTLTSTAKFDNPDPTRFDTFCWDRQSDGTIVFSGQTETAPRVVSPFLAWTSADGKLQRLQRTDHYFPYEVAVAPDDTVWTLGYEMVNLDVTDPAVNQEAHVLRHFDKSGNLIGSAFPQRQFNRYQRSALAHGLLVATPHLLGWYGQQSGKAAYTEIPLHTMTMNEYPSVPSKAGKRALAEGVAITDAGAVSVSLEDWSPTARTTYVLDRATSTWVPVSVPPLGGFNFTPNLIGSDGDNLVFKFGREVAFFSVAQ